MSGSMGMYAATNLDDPRHPFHQLAMRRPQMAPQQEMSAAPQNPMASPMPGYQPQMTQISPAAAPGMNMNGLGTQAGNGIAKLLANWNAGADQMLKKLGASPAITATSGGLAP